MDILQKPIESVIPYARNPRKNQAAIAKVAASIKEFGWQQPIVVDSQMVIVAGHTRHQAAIQLGMDHVPVLVADGLTVEQVRAYRLADNRVSEDAEWDEDMLAVELQELLGSGYDMNMTGFTPEELDLYTAFGDSVDREGDTGDDAIPDLPADPASRHGDVWILGAHRLMCGDATQADQLFTLMDGQLADAVWTDPPYNVNYKNGSIKNDDMADGDFYQFLYDAFTGVMMNMKSGAAIYVAHSDTEGLNFRRAFIDAGLKLSGCLIWQKNSLVLGRSDYQWRHEPILYGWKPGEAHQWMGDRKETTILDADIPDVVAINANECQVEIDGRIYTITGEGLKVEGVEGSVLRIDRPTKSKGHPTMKPVALIRRMLANSVAPGQMVIDPFGGSGSTLIACEKSRLHSCLMELDPRYVDLIITRWQDFTGRHAVHAETGERFNG